MKSRIFLISALAFLAVSCENNGDDAVDPHFIRIQVNQEPFVDEDAKEYALEWFEADSIKLFDTDMRGVTVKTNNFTEKNAPEVFFSPDWTAGTPQYMIRPVSEDVVSTADGVEGVVIDAEQEIIFNGSFGTVPSMGKVTGNRTAYRATMKNLTGAVAFAMTDSTVKSVSISSVGGEPLAGTVDVDYAMLESGQEGFWTLSEGTDGASTLTVVPKAGSAVISADNTFQSGVFYANILPQTYSRGLKVVATFPDGKITEQFIEGGESGLVVKPSDIVSVKKAMDDTLPDEFEVKLDFTGDWPFKESIVAGASQAQSGLGDKYTLEYSYQNGASTYVMDLPFHIYGNKKAYTNFITSSPHQLRMAANNTRLTTPAIYGRYLKSIKLEVVNAAGKAFNVVGLDWANLVKPGPSATNAAPAVVTFPYGENAVKTAKGTSYYVQFAAGNTYITAITLVYSMTLE